MPFPFDLYRAPRRVTGSGKPATILPSSGPVPLVEDPAPPRNYTLKTYVFPFPARMTLGTIIAAGATRTDTVQGRGFLAALSWSLNDGLTGEMEFDNNGTKRITFAPNLVDTGAAQPNDRYLNGSIEFAPHEWDFFDRVTVRFDNSLGSESVHPQVIARLALVTE